MTCWHPLMTSLALEPGIWLIEMPTEGLPSVAVGTPYRFGRRRILMRAMFFNLRY